MSMFNGKISYTWLVYAILNSYFARTREGTWRRWFQIPKKGQRPRGSTVQHPEIQLSHTHCHGIIQRLEKKTLWKGALWHVLQVTSILQKYLAEKSSKNVLFQVEKESMTKDWGKLFRVDKVSWGLGLLLNALQFVGQCIITLAHTNVHTFKGL